MWPFWLLIAAWLCANTPPRALHVAVAWIGEARSFSHQRSLTRDVAHLLGGEKTPEHFTAAEETAPTKPRPAIPENDGVKKIQLALESAGDEPQPETRKNSWHALQPALRGRLGAAPPHEPPRAEARS